MRATPFAYHRGPRRGFSLLELLVSMSILTVIVAALYGMFYQTQKALRANVAQVDTMEAGRAAMELLIGDLERGRAVNLPGVTNLILRKQYLGGVQQPYTAGNVLDVIHRDSALHEVYYVTPVQGNQWAGLGWFVANYTNPVAPVDGNLGALYRFEGPSEVVARGPSATNAFETLYQTFESVGGRTLYTSRLIDGVVFFRLLPFGPRGLPIDYTVATNLLPAEVAVTLQPGIEQALTTFTDRALPAAVEVELGALPPRLLVEYRNLGNAALQGAYITNHSADLLVFRQRITLRTATQ